MFYDGAINCKLVYINDSYDSVSDDDNDNDDNNYNNNNDMTKQSCNKVKLKVSGSCYYIVYRCREDCWRD